MSNKITSLMVISLILIFTGTCFSQGMQTEKNVLKNQADSSIAYSSSNETISGWIKSDTLPKNPLNQVGIMHLQSLYGSNIQTMSTSSLQYLRKTKDEKFTYIGRINLRVRGESSSVKYDAEMYMKHGKRHYSFLSLSTSDKKMYPGFEGAYSLYNSLDKGWELETGAKFLAADNFNLFIPIVGASKEFGNNTVTFRNFFTFVESNLYYSNTISWKNRINEKKDNISIITGYGNGPDSKNIDFSQDFINNKSIFIGAGFEKNFHPFKISVSTVYNRNNYSTGRKFNQVDIYANLFYDF